MSSIAANLERVSRRIQQAAQRAGRNAEDITLVAVTKTHPVETVIEAYRQGLRNFGENRADEGYEKSRQFSERLAADIQRDPAQWHFIGHLQSRQAGLVLAGRVDLIHSVDSLKLAQRLHRLAERDDYPPVNILLQCNVSGEATKSGFELSDWAKDRQQFDAFIVAVNEISQLNRTTIRGLMTMAPIVHNPEEVRPVFQSLAGLKNKLAQELPQIDWRHLSMGMTADFEVAIEEGATIVRIGRAIFGERGFLGD
jgi:hypothetical protein